MNRCYRFLLVAVLALSSVAVAAQSSQAAKKTPSKAEDAAGVLPSEATVNAFLQKMFGWDQNVTWKVAEIKPSEAPGISEITVIFSSAQGQQVARLYVTPDQKYAFSGDLVPFGADPFASARDILKHEGNGIARGPKDAAVTIYEFGDLECPACKAAQANLNKLMDEEPKVRLVFQNYPLEQIHKWAMLAAKYSDCMAHSNIDAFWKFVETVYDHQGEINEQNAEQMLKSYAKDSGGDPTAIAACAATQDTEKHVRDSMMLGQKLNVTSTPTFFINGRKVSSFVNMPYDAVKSMVDYDVSQATTTSASK